MAGQRDIFGRWFVRVHPVRMRVVKAEEGETALAAFVSQSRDVPGRDHVVPYRIGGDVPCGERARDHIVLAGQNSAAFPMRLTAGVRQHLPEHFAATLDGANHVEIL